MIRHRSKVFEKQMHVFKRTNIETIGLDLKPGKCTAENCHLTVFRTI